MRDPFVHLHVASAYSLRYGVARPDALVQRAAEHGMDVLGLTDRDGLYGAVKHVLACEKAGIRPVVGVDLAVAGPAGSARGSNARRGGEGAEPPPSRRVTLLAVGERGWASLCRLLTATHLSGERGEPVTTRRLVAEHADGLVALLGPASDVGVAVAERRPDLAARRLSYWRDAVGDLVVEVVDHRNREDSHRAARMLSLAREAGVPAVLGNAVRYLDAADAPVAQVLDVSRKLVPLHRRHLEQCGRQAYLKSGKEMTQVAELICGPDQAAATELFRATRRLAERCALDPGADLRMDDLHLPDVGDDAMAELAARCADGLVRRRLDRDMRARDRLADELAVIRRKGLAAYFVVVADVAALIRSYGIRCAIRGSGAGSLVNYLLGIGDVDPLAHGLVMERFLADSRPGLPDIDLDVESARRLEAYRLVFDRYGEDRVACVSMMETYRARSAIRDVGAAVGLPPHEIDAVAKAFPHIRARQIQAALKELPELRQSGLGEAQLAGVFRIAERLDGLPRHIALHPCGVVLSNLSLLDRTPVERSFLGFPMSQFDKDDVEEMSLLKLDVIGVRMQSAMAHAVAEIERVGGERVDLEAVPLDDEPTYELIRTSRTLGCFQIESPGQRELVAKLEPRDLDDLVIDISLFRPGPVNSDMVTPFLEIRHGWRSPDYLHRHLVEVLRESSGVVVFHEQVLRIIDAMTGCGLSHAEWARRQLASDAGKAEVGTWFRAATLARGYDAATVDRVWTMLTAFGAFGFCKAHAASFALPTYQSAWLKRHHPAAFFAGVLTHEPGMYPKRAIVDDARHFGVPVLPLDVNASAADWQAQPLSRMRGAYGLRVGLSEVKGISDGEVARIIAGRPYHSLADLWHRAKVSRRVVERVALVGGFDSLYGIQLADLEVSGVSRRVDTPLTSRSARKVSRRDLLCQVGVLDRAGARRALSGGFGDVQLPLGVVEEVPAGELPELTLAEVVEAELEILGIDVSRHVLSFYGDLLDALGVVRSDALLGHRSDAEVLVAGVKIATQTPAVRSGQRIIFTTIDDATGPVDATFFESVQDRCAATVFGSWLLVIQGRLRRTGGRAVSLNATACWDLVRLDDAFRVGGLDAVRQVMELTSRIPAGGSMGSRVVYPNGYQLSPYADINPAGSPAKHPPRKLWHASGGSSGGWLARTG